MRAREENRAYFAGNRTLKAGEQLRKALVDCGMIDDDETTKRAGGICEGFLKKPKGEGDGGETSTLLYLSPNEIKKMAAAVFEAWSKDKGIGVKKLTDAAARALKGTKQKKEVLPNDAADIAIFGRMVANEASLTLEGAGLFSHALSTHRCENDIDFFTAVDDFKTAGEDAGAGMIGVLEFNSATYYRYVALNVDLLFDENHLGDLTDDERKQIISAFVKATLMAVPSARHNSMNGHTPPAFVLGLGRTNGQPLQLVNAFESPVRPANAGLIGPSVEALLRHHAGLKKVFGIVPNVELATGFHEFEPSDGKSDKLTPVPLEAFSEAMVDFACRRD